MQVWKYQPESVSSMEVVIVSRSLVNESLGAFASVSNFLGVGDQDDNYPFPYNPTQQHFLPVIVNHIQRTFSDFSELSMRTVRTHGDFILTAPMFLFFQELLPMPKVTAVKTIYEYVRNNNQNKTVLFRTRNKAPKKHWVAYLCSIGVRWLIATNCISRSTCNC